MAASLGGLGPRVAGVALRSTGLTGLTVSKNPHYTLTAIYGKTLRSLQKLPYQCVYRQSTEKIIKERLDHVTKIKDPTNLEQKINAGMLEELIIQAEYELVLARNMLHWKPWEPLIAEAPENQWQWPIKAIAAGEAHENR